jgi:S-adenosylmethionine hydrolase
MRLFVTILLAAAVMGACSSTQVDVDSTSTVSTKVIANAMVTDIGTHGNGYTNLTNSTLDSAGVNAGDRIVFTFDEKELVFTVGSTYSDVPEGENVAVLHREGTVVLAVYNGSFNEIHGIESGATFSVTTASAE